MHKLAHVQRKGCLLRVLRAWRRTAASRRATRRRVTMLCARWNATKQRQQLLLWQAVTQYRSHLRQCEAELSKVVSRRELQAAMRQLSLGVRAHRAEHAMRRRRMHVVISAWHSTAQRRGRARRVAAAAAAARLSLLLERAFHAWCLLGAWRHARMLSEDASRMQASPDHVSLCSALSPCLPDLHKPQRVIHLAYTSP